MSKRIMIVDDESHTLQALTMILKNAGYEAFPAVDGVSAMAKLDELANSAVNDVDVLLTDIQMPNMNGLELIRAYRDSGRTAPVVVFSGHGDKELLVKILREGCEDYLDKPFSREQLLEVVEKALERRRRRSEESKEDKRRFLDVFHSTLSHEIRTPMNGMIGFLELLFDDAYSEKQRKMFKTEFVESCEKLLDYLRRLEYLASLENDGMERNFSNLDVSKVLCDLLENGGGESPESCGGSIDVRIDENRLPSSSLTVWSHKELLIRALWSVVSEASRLSAVGEVVLGVETSSDEVTFSISPAEFLPDPERMDAIAKILAGRTGENGHAKSHLDLHIAGSLRKIIRGELRLERDAANGPEFQLTVPANASSTSRDAADNKHIGVIAS